MLSVAFKNFYSSLETKGERSELLKESMRCILLSLCPEVESNSLVCLSKRTYSERHPIKKKEMHSLLEYIEKNIEKNPTRLFSTNVILYWIGAKVHNVSECVAWK